jgi:hypothetical protein
MTTTTPGHAAPGERIRNGGAVAAQHRSVAERVARRKGARAQVPRSRHAVF